MLVSIRRRLTYANVLATAALFVALGGSSYAALTVTGKNIKNSSVTGKDIKNSSLGTADVKNGALLAADFKSGQIPAGPRGATGAAGATGATGATGAKGADGTALGYARIDGATGAATLNKGISSGNVNRIGGGAYCISGLAFTPQNVVVTPESPGGNFDPEVGIGVGPSSCPAGTQVRVFTRTSAGALTDKSFFVLLN